MDKYSIGPFAFDGQKVRMDAGTYILSKPLDFVVPEGAPIEGVTYQPLINSDASPAVLESVSNEDMAA